MAKQTIEVDIIEIDGANNTILVDVYQNGACVSQEQLKLADWIKSNILKEGKYNATIDDTGTVTFIKSKNAENKPFFKKQEYKKPFVPNNSFEKKIEKSKVQTFEGITLEEYKQIYNELSTRVKINASQVFPRNTTKTEETSEIHNKYDAIIYFYE